MNASPSNSHDLLPVLNRLLVLHSRSLARYLMDARPWTGRSQASALETIRHIAIDHQATADQIGRRIIEANGTVSHGEYPVRFTGWHDLSLDFLVRHLTAAQRALIDQIEICAKGLISDPSAHALAEQSLGAAKAHLESLVDVTGAAK